MSRPVVCRLSCHPATPTDAVRELRASIGRPRADAIEVAFRLAGTLSCIRLPVPGLARRGERLWEHTCFELFLAREGERAYHELNFAPSGEWAAYTFRDYRDAVSCKEPATPRVSVRTRDDRVELDARVSLLDPWNELARLRVGLSAVVETNDGRRSYWALRHPRDTPDFHHPDAFALWLESPLAG